MITIDVQERVKTPFGTLTTWPELAKLLTRKGDRPSLGKCQLFGIDRILTNFGGRRKLSPIKLVILLSRRQLKIFPGMLSTWLAWALLTSLVLPLPAPEKNRAR